MPCSTNQRLPNVHCRTFHSIAQVIIMFVPRSKLLNNLIKNATPYYKDRETSYVKGAICRTQKEKSSNSEFVVRISKRGASGWENERYATFQSAR